MKYGAARDKRQPHETQKNPCLSGPHKPENRGPGGENLSPPCSFPHFSREMGPPLGRRTPVALSGRFVKRPYDGVGGDHNPDE